MAGKTMAGWQPALAARYRVHYGWVVVAVTMPTMLVAAGLRDRRGAPWRVAHVPSRRTAVAGRL